MPSLIPFFERLDCPVCGHDESTEYYSRPFASGEVRDFLFAYYRLDELFSQHSWAAKVGDARYVLCECRRCQALFQRYSPDTGFALEIYSQWIDRNRTDEPKYEIGEYAHWITESLELTDLVMRKMGLTSPNEVRVLDYGMGEGIFLRAMAACGCQVWGYDFAETRQAKAERRGLRTVGLAQIAGMQFDLVNTEQVFEHLPDPLDKGRFLSRVLSPGGLLKISVPYNKWLEHGDRKIDWKAGRYAKHSYMPLQPLEHLNYFRRSSIDVLAAELGLKRVTQSRVDLLRYAAQWTSPRRAVRNLGKALFRDRVRNYHLLQKPALPDARTST